MFRAVCGGRGRILGSFLGIGGGVRWIGALLVVSSVIRLALGRGGRLRPMIFFAIIYSFIMLLCDRYNRQPDRTSRWYFHCSF